MEDKSMLITIEGLDGSGKTTTVNKLKEIFSGDDVLITKEPYDSHWLGKQVRDALSDSSVSPISTLLLFMSDYTYHYTNVVKPALESGHTVISDRYIGSRCAYQGHSIVDEGNAVDFVQSLHYDVSWQLDTTDDTYLDYVGYAKENMPADMYHYTPPLGRYFYGASQLIEAELLPTGVSTPTELLPALKRLETTQRNEHQPDITVYLDANVETCIERIGNRTSTEKFEYAEFLAPVKENYEYMIDTDPEQFIVIDSEQPIEKMEQEISQKIADVL